MSDISVNNQDLSTPAQPSLNIQDIASLLNIVDVASRRGAFKAEELTSVGGIYDRVMNFMRSTGAIKDPAETAQEEPKEETEGNK